MTRNRWPAILSLVGLAVGGAGLLAANVAPVVRKDSVEIGSYATSLVGRTSGQRENARLSARAIDGAIVKRGGVFSYNALVKAWSREPGYVRAPVSVGGNIVSALGGGVCQTSSTLYNAALVSGMDILERHPHAALPRYVPPGRDAAVAYPGVDLRFRNPYPWPIRVRAQAKSGRILVRIEALTASVGERVGPISIESDVRRVDSVRRVEVRSGLRTAGASGCRVIVYKTDGVRRRRLSDDTYASLDARIPLGQ